MKKIILPIIAILFLAQLHAQAPFKFNYQAAVRDGSGLLANALMDIRISILDLSPTGAVIYQEQHQGKQTDQYGLLNLRIGEGQPITGSMANIAWGIGNKYVKVETNYGGSGFQAIGQPTQLVSVPYALYAESSGNASNDVQSLEIIGYELSISGSNAVILPSYSAGTGISISPFPENTISAADPSPTNEIQQLNLSGSQLSLTNGGGSVTLPSGTAYTAGSGISINGSTISNTGDADNNPNNEIQQLNLNGSQLTLTNGGGSVTLPAGTAYTAGSGININGSTISNTGDADSNPTNEIQQLNLIGSQLSLTNGGGVVTLPTGTTYTAGSGISISGSTISNTGDADSNPNNEIQQLNLNGSQLSLTNGGGAVTLPTGTPYTAGSGISINGSTISNTGDADSNPTNEIQQLNLNGSQLSLTNGGGSVTLPVGTNYTAGNGIAIAGNAISSSTWQKTGSDVYYNGGKVGIGVSNPTQELTVKTEILGLAPAGNNVYQAGDNSEGAGYFYTYGPNGKINAVFSSVSSYPNNGYVGVLDENGEVTGAMRSGTNGSGIISTNGPNESSNVRLTTLASNPNHGYVTVDDASSESQAGMFVNSDGIGQIFANGPNGGIKNFRMPHPTQPGMLICYASIEGPEAAAYCRGTGNLNNGEGIVYFTEDFSIVANETTMTVILTPLSTESKGLAVVEKTSDGFVVKELLNGKGTYKFDWEVKAVRKGHEGYRVIRDVIESMPAIEKNEIKN